MILEIVTNYNIYEEILSGMYTCEIGIYTYLQIKNILIFYLVYIYILIF